MDARGRSTGGALPQLGEQFVAVDVLALPHRMTWPGPPNDFGISCGAKRRQTACRG